jgi:hypothetical protein
MMSVLVEVGEGIDESNQGLLCCAQTGLCVGL